MSAKRRSFVGPAGTWSASACAGAFAGVATRAPSNTKISDKCRRRRKGLGFINDAPEDGFLLGTMDPYMDGWPCEIVSLCSILHLAAMDCARQRCCYNSVVSNSIPGHNPFRAAVI